MDGDQAKEKNLVETTDCLEAVGVFRGWKNFLFIIVVLCLILLQASFWAVNSGYIKTGDKIRSVDKAVEVIRQSPSGTQLPEPWPPPAKDLIVPLEENQPKQPAEKPTEAGETAGKQTSESVRRGFMFGIKFKHLAWFIRFVNFVVVLVAVLYCLTILFILKVSLLGRLGGIDHICRAFFLSLVMVVLLLPWQIVFGGVVAGAIYTAGELASCSAAETGGIFEATLYYLRFTGYWVLVMLLLIFSQSRSCRWTKATLRRLEVI